MKFKKGDRITRIGLDGDRYHLDWKNRLKERGMIDGNVYTFTQYIDNYDGKLSVAEFGNDSKRFKLIKENHVIKLLKEVDECSD